MPTGNPGYIKNGKSFDLQQWNSKIRPEPVHIRTCVWGKNWAICEGERIKQLAQKQLPGTFFKIVDSVTKKSVQDTYKEIRDNNRKRRNNEQKALQLKIAL